MGPSHRRLLSGAALLVAVAAGLALATAVPPAADPADPLSDRAALLRRADALDGLQALVVHRRGELVVEAYFEGAARDRLLHLRSATKSVTSMLIGIALDKGLLSSLTPPGRSRSGWPSATLGR